MLTVCKKFSFCYGHQLPGYEGLCANLHGHNSEVEVEVSGRDEGSYQDMVIDFKKLKELMSTILGRLDHQFINKTLPKHFLPPVAENMVQFMASEIVDMLPDGVELERVRVTETPTSWAEWRRE